MSKKIITIALIILAVVTGVFMHFQSVDSSARTKNIAELSAQMNSAPEIMKTYKLDGITLTIPAPTENDVAVSIGDNAATEFKPELNLNKWNGEVKLKITPLLSAEENKSKTITLIDNKVQVTTPKVDYRIYELKDNVQRPFLYGEQIKNGAFEFDAVLKEKPSSNKIDFAVETTNLDFFYQPPLNEEKNPKADHCTETECFDKAGKVITTRPENVVGSYAVYYKDGKSGNLSEIGGKNYKTGKAFHIYRPQIIDADGKKAWGTLAINTTKEILTVIVPQAFLNSATYPVVVDPTFGYTGIGGSSTLNSQDHMYCTSGNPGGSGTVTQISVYAKTDTGTNNWKGGLYIQSTLALVSPQSAAGATITSTAQWLNATVSDTSVSNQNYYVCAWHNATVAPGQTLFYYDTGQPTNNGIDRYPAVYGAWPDPMDNYTQETTRYSMYATYTASGYGKNFGLVGYWKFDEGAGVKAMDYSGNGNTGTITGATWTSGKLGQALSFNGVDTAVSNNTDVVGTGAATISAWIKPKSYGSSNYGVVFSNAQVQLAIESVSHNNLLWSNDNGGTVAESAINSISLNVWQHVVGVRQSDGTVTLYINGSQSGGTGQSAGSASAGNSTNIGKRAISAYWFDGTLDDVRIYNRALSQAEITALYQAGEAKIKAPTNNGLVGYWKFDEGAGVKAMDYSGNGNTGTITGATWTSGKLGQALSFNGTSDLVNTGSDLYGTGTFTVCAWAKPKSTAAWVLKAISGNGRSFFDNINTGSNNYWILSSDGGANTVWSATDALVLNTWQHVCGVRLSSGLATMYVNGAVSGSENQNSGTPETYGYATVIGASRSDATSPFDGLIDDVRIYNRALSQAEITALYQSGEAKIKAPTNNGLVGYWKFDEGAGVKAIDYSGNNNTGAITGATWTSGKLGKGLSFNGVNDYIDAGTFDPSTGNLTVSAWVYWKGGNSDWQQIITKRDNWSASGMRWQFGITSPSSPWPLGFDTYSLPTINFGIGLLGTNQWIHVVAVKSGTTVTLYQNGAISGTPETGFSFDSGTTAHVVIGAESITSTGETFNGLIDDVRVYNRALTQSEITTLYQAGATKIK